MINETRRDNNVLDSLSEREFELLKLELQLLQQKIAENENIQYRLRQFSMTLWILVIGVGLGITSYGKSNLILLSISSIVPTLFLYLDIKYAMFCQKIRSRRNAIILFINPIYKFKHRITYKYKLISEESTDRNKFPILDLTGDLTCFNDPQTLYRRSFIVKLTRTIRLLFYGFQIFGSVFLFCNFFVFENHLKVYLYYFPILFLPIILAFIFLKRNKYKKNIKKNLPEDYDLPINEGADRIY